MSDDTDRSPSEDAVTERLNELAKDMDDDASLALGSASARRLIDAGCWQW